MKYIIRKLKIIFTGIGLIIMSLAIIACGFFLVEKINKIKDFYTILSSISTTFAAIGGLALLFVTYFTFVDTKDQRKLENEPVITLRLVPDEKNSNFINFSLRNTGGGPAYDLNVVFTPNLNYNKATLNDLAIFKRLPLIDKGEKIEFLFDSLIEYYNSDNPKIINATATYYVYPKNKRKSKQIQRSFELNLEENKGQMQIVKKDFNDIVKELEEIKHFLAISRSLTKNEGTEVKELKNEVLDLKKKIEDISSGEK